MGRDAAQAQSQQLVVHFLRDKAVVTDLKTKLLRCRSQLAHIVRRVCERRRLLQMRLQILHTLFQEEKRFLLETLSASKRKATRELIKKGKLHEIDRPGGTLEKAILYFYQKGLADYNDRFNTWRMNNFPNGGILQSALTRSDPNLLTKQKDPLLEQIFKGTDIVDDEQTVAKSHERRQELRRIEMAELAAQKKASAKKALVKGSSSAYLQAESSDEEKPGYPAPPVFNSLPSSLEFVHRLIIKCTDPKFMQAPKTKKA